MSKGVKMLPMLLFGIVGIVWGSNFIYMKWASEYISATQIVLLRVVFGFFPVLLYAFLRKELRLAHLKHIGHFLIMSLIATVFYYYGFAKGTALLFSGVAGVLSGSIPIFSFMLALFILPEEKATFNKCLGVVLGFIGVVLIANPFAADVSTTNIEGVLYMMMGSLSVGVSFIYAKKYVIPLKIPSAALTTYQLGFALIVLFFITDIQGIENIMASTHVAIGAMLGLGVLGTGLAYIIYYYLIDKLGAVSASTSTYLPPVVALIIGAVFVGEAIVMLDYVAAAIIFIGIILVNSKKSKQ